MAQRPLPGDQPSSWEAGAPVPARVYPYIAGEVGGLLGGIAMAIVAMIASMLSGLGPWFPMNLAAATIFRFYQTAPIEVLQQFSYPALIVGLLLHLTISVIIGLLFVILLPTLPGRPIVWGAILGPLLWFGAQFVVLPLINARLSLEVWSITFFIMHLVYGLVLGWWVERTPKVPAELPGEPTLPID